MVNFWANIKILNEIAEIFTELLREKPFIKHVFESFFENDNNRPNLAKLLCSDIDYRKVENKIENLTLSLNFFYVKIENPFFIINYEIIKIAKLEIYWKVSGMRIKVIMYFMFILENYFPCSEILSFNYFGQTASKNENNGSRWDFPVWGMI